MRRECKKKLNERLLFDKCEHILHIKCVLCALNEVKGDALFICALGIYIVVIFFLLLIPSFILHSNGKPIDFPCNRKREVEKEEEGKKRR